MDIQLSTMRREVSMVDLGISTEKVGATKNQLLKQLVNTVIMSHAHNYFNNFFKS